MTPATRLLEDLRDVLNDRDPSEDAVVAALRSLDGVRALYPAAHAIGERVSVRDWLNLRTPDGPSELDFTGEVVGVQFIDGKVLYVVDAGAGLFASGRQVVDSAFVHPAPDTMMCMDCGARGLTDLRKHDAECPRPGERPTEAPPPMPFHNLVDDPPTTTLIEPSSETGSLAEALAAGDVAPFRGRHYLGTGPQSPGAITVPEESPTSSIADIQKTTFDPAVHGNAIPGFGPATRTNTLLIPGRVQVTTHTDEHGVKTTETVDLRDPDDKHARFAEALGQEWRKLEASKDVRHEWLAAFERAVEIAGEVWAKVPEQSPGPHIAPGFTCPKCGSSLWGTYDCTEPKETWTGVCHGCRFTWNRLTQDVEVGLGPEAMNPGGNTGLGLVPQSVTVATEARAFDPFDASFTDEERRGGERALDLFAAMLEARGRPRIDPTAHIVRYDELRPCPDCGTTPSQPHQPGCPTGSRSW